MLYIHGGGWIFVGVGIREMDASGPIIHGHNCGRSRVRVKRCILCREHSTYIHAKKEGKKERGLTDWALNSTWRGEGLTVVELLERCEEVCLSMSI